MKITNGMKFFPEKQKKIKLDTSLQKINITYVFPSWESQHHICRVLLQNKDRDTLINFWKILKEKKLKNDGNALII